MNHNDESLFGCSRAAKPPTSGIGEGRVWFDQAMTCTWIISYWSIAEVRMSFISDWSQQCTRPAEQALFGIMLLHCNLDITRRNPFTLDSSCISLTHHDQLANPSSLNICTQSLAVTQNTKSKFLPLWLFNKWMFELSLRVLKIGFWKESGRCLLQTVVGSIWVCVLAHNEQGSKHSLTSS